MMKTTKAMARRLLLKAQRRVKRAEKLLIQAEVWRTAARMCQ